MWMFRGGRACSQWGLVHRFHVLFACRKFWFPNIIENSAEDVLPVLQVGVIARAAAAASTTVLVIVILAKCRRRHSHVKTEELLMESQPEEEGGEGLPSTCWCW